MNWVPQHIATQHPTSSYTGDIWRNRWANLYSFLCEQRILIPRQIRRTHAPQYIAWRARPHPGMRVARHNTALTELHFLSYLMREAVALGFVPTNPLQRLGINVQPRREKPELTDEQLELVSRLIEQDRGHAHYMHLRNSFDIARWQGCRVAETQLNPMADVVLNRAADGKVTTGTIQFRIKQGRLHTTTLHPRLFPLFERLQADGATTTYPVCLDAKKRPRIAG